MHNIRQTLQEETLLLRLKEHIMLNDHYRQQPIKVGIRRIDDNNMLFVYPDGTERDVENAYFLPWRADTGYYIDIPIEEPKAYLFFTAELTGCCVGVQRMGNNVRICHYNVQKTEFDQSDFERYNYEAHDRHWLIPVKYESKMKGKNANFYGGYSGGTNPTCFWGEYDKGEWRFYYQTPDRNVHLFDY